MPSVPAARIINGGLYGVMIGFGLAGCDRNRLHAEGLSLRAFSEATSACCSARFVAEISSHNETSLFSAPMKRPAGDSLGCCLAFGSLGMVLAMRSNKEFLAHHPLRPF